MANLSRADKRRLASVLLAAAGNLMEADWQCGYFDDIKHLDTEEGRQAAAQQLADWLGRLPGYDWDVRLPYPSYETS